MKPEKPKKAKAPAKRTQPPAVKESNPTSKPLSSGSAAAKSTRPAAAGAKPSKAPRSSAQPKAAKSGVTSRKKLVVPPILFEGDAPAKPGPSGPGQRYEIGSSTAASDAEPLELPEAYGTQRLLIVARDPRWVYVHWDMTGEQLREHNRQSRDGHLVVRVFRDQPAGAPVVEQHVHPESRNWFIHVGRGGCKYFAQLGYYKAGGGWNSIATSSATFTPPDALSDDVSVRFETIPLEVPFARLLELVKGAVAEHTPLVDVIEELRTAGHAELPRAEHAAAASAWTPAQERALAAVVSIDEVRRVWMGSLEITELIRRAMETELSSQAAAGQPGAAVFQPGGVSSISSPFGGTAKRKGFWFNVNAELIIYGATEPDASVTIGRRKIQLRPDGTFSFRFALPDGKYQLPIEAVSADGDDARSADLSFERATDYRGEVGTHPQDSRLKAPRAEHVS